MCSSERAAISSIVVSLPGGGSARYNAACCHQTCDEFDPRRGMTGAAQEGGVAYGLGREIAMGRSWPSWSAAESFAAERAKSQSTRQP